MKRFTVSYSLFAAVFVVLAGWLGISYMDVRIAAQGQSLIDKARMGYLQQGGSEAHWRWRAFGVPGTVCKALTGELGWTWMLRHANALNWPDRLVVGAEGAGCIAGNKNNIVFTIADPTLTD